MPPNAHKFVDAIPTRYGVRLVAKPEAIDDIWRQDRGIGESMIRQRAELMSVRSRDAMLPGATPPPSHRKAFAKDDLDPQERRTRVRDEPNMTGEDDEPR